MSDPENGQKLTEPAAAGAAPADEAVETNAPAVASDAATAAVGPRSEAAAPGGRRPTRPNLVAERTAVSREHAGYDFVLAPAELARLRELPGARGKSDEELGGEFLEAHEERLATALAGDVAAPATVQVLVDPYSRQAFLALGNRIVGIVSF